MSPASTQSRRTVSRTRTSQLVPISSALSFNNDDMTMDDDSITVEQEPPPSFQTLAMVSLDRNMAPRPDLRTSPQNLLTVEINNSHLGSFYSGRKDRAAFKGVLGSMTSILRLPTSTVCDVTLLNPPQDLAICYCHRKVEVTRAYECAYTMATAATFYLGEVARENILRFLIDEEPMPAAAE